MISHYETLGVAASADEGAIREAYRRRARELHPDRVGGDADAMASLNEAYQVLADPGRRSRYDATLTAATRSSAPSGVNGSTVAVPRSVAVVTAPARFPWRFMAGMAAVGSAVVLVGAALYEPSAPPPADGVVHVGSCVAVVERDQTAREIRCDDTAFFEVTKIVVPGTRCGSGERPLRDVLRGDTLCVKQR